MSWLSKKDSFAITVFLIALAWGFFAPSSPGAEYTFALKISKGFQGACETLSKEIKKQKNGTYLLSRHSFDKAKGQALALTDAVQRDFLLMALQKMNEQCAKAYNSNDLVFVHPALAHLVTKRSAKVFQHRLDSALQAEILMELSAIGEDELEVQLAEFLVRYATCPVFEVTFRRRGLPSRMGRLAEHEPYLIDQYFGLATECQSRVTEIFRYFARSWQKRFPERPLLLLPFDGSEDSQKLLKDRSDYAGYHHLFGLEVGEWANLFFDPWFLQNNDVPSVVRKGEFLARRRRARVVSTYGGKVTQ